jgi:CubicO group peptidase (beta-lactamase class C family)
VGIAIENGDLTGLDQAVADHVPEWQGTPRDQITLRHLVSMTSGLEWSAFDDYVVMATLAQDHTQHALGRQLAVPPGSEWTYNNAAVQILEPVFRAATGLTIEQYAEQHLWSRIGMSASWAHDPAGNPTSYASVLASCRDHARFGYLYLHGGRWAGAEVVPELFVSTSLAPSQAMNQGYGLLWWLNGHEPALTALMEPFPGPISPASPPDMFGAHGFGNQFIDVFPSLDMIVVRFGRDPLDTFDLPALIEDASLQKHEAIIQPLLQAVID